MMLSVNKLFLFSHEHIVSRKELVYYKRFPLIFVYVFQYIFKKVDVLSFHSHSTQKTTTKKSMTLVKKFVLMYFYFFLSRCRGAGTMQHPVYYCNRLGFNFKSVNPDLRTRLSCVTLDCLLTATSQRLHHLCFLPCS